MATVDLVSFDTIRRTVQQLSGNRLDQVRATTVLNEAVLHLWNDYQWSQAKTDTTLVLRAPKSQGTVSLAFDARQVIGFDTAFTSADVGSYLRLNSQITALRVVAVSGQTLTLEQPVPDGHFTGELYSLFRHIYPLPDDWRLFLSPTYWDQLQQVPQQHLDRLDPQRTQRGSLPTHYAMRGPDATGVMQVEVWPVPSTSVLLRYSYLRRLVLYGPLDGGRMVPLRPDLVSYLAAGEGLMALAAESGNRQDAAVLMGLGERWLVMGQRILEDAYRADRHVFGVPDSVVHYQVGLEAMGAYYTFLPGFVEDGGAVSEDDRVAALSWFEIEVPPLSSDVRRALISGFVIDAPDTADRQARVSWLMLETPTAGLARVVLGWFEVEAPQTPHRRVGLSWIEIEAPEVQAPQAAIVSWLEVETSEASNRQVWLSWISVEAPSPPTPQAAILSWLVVETPDASNRQAWLSWIAVEVPSPPAAQQARLSWLQVEAPDSTSRRADLSWIEIQTP